MNKSNVLLNKPNAAVIIVKNEIGEIRSNSGKCKYVSSGADQAVEKYFNRASCEISVADFPWRAEKTLQALVS